MLTTLNSLWDYNSSILWAKPTFGRLAFVIIILLYAYIFALQCRLRADTKIEAINALRVRQEELRNENDFWMDLEQKS
jgi:hypothetical protein